MSKLEIPESLKHGHENLCSELDSIIELGGSIGEQAKILKEIMTPHFKKEEKFALPPLGLLLTLSEGNWEMDTKKAIKMSEQLESRLFELKQDHEDIFKALQDLETVAKKENNFITIQFVKNLMIHAEIEDQVLYPSTILVGNYLKSIQNN